MEKNVLCKKKIRVLSFLYLLVVATTMSLGIWQMYRLEYKNNHINEIHQNAMASPGLMANCINGCAEYAHVEGDITIDYDNVMWLYRRYPFAKYVDGSYMMVHGSVVDVKTGQEYHIPVVLGWVVDDQKDQVLKEMRDQNPLKIHGLILSTEKSSMLIPKNDVKNKTFFTLNTSELSSIWGIPNNNYYMATLDGVGDKKVTIKESESLDGVLPITKDMMIKIPNNHMEYAITWFSCSIIATIMYVIFRKKYYEELKQFDEKTKEV